MKHFILNSFTCALLCTITLILSACASPQMKAESVEKRLSRQYSNDVFSVSQLAENAYRESRWIEAAQHYQHLTEKVPGDAYVWFRLANTYVQKGDFNEAIHAYQMSIERDSLQPKPWFNLSTTYLLTAKTALLHSWENLRTGDPAKELIVRRIDAIDRLINDEMRPVGAHR